MSRFFVRKRSSGVSAYVDSLQIEDTGQHSVGGNVKTLRSKLQARRVTLSEAIEKENLFLQGSERLASITHDQKTRDQASLQKDFAESKIKTLQAELTKINSSLHAYQAESAKGVQVPIIPLAMKTMMKLDMTTALSNIVEEHYHTDPESLRESIANFNELRQSLDSTERSEVGIELLFRYYKQLMLVSKRLLHSKLDHGITFIWYDAITGLPASQQSTVFERACVVFNIGALYSQLAAKVDRCSAENLDAAIALLERSIGAFEYTKIKFTHSPMKDMTGEILSLISDLMRAQAQEMLWEKEVLAGLKEDNLMNLFDYSHRTKSVAECYKPVRDLTESDVIKKYLPDTWVALLKIKEAHYKALAHYYAGMVHNHLATLYSEEKRIPEDVYTEIRFLYSNCPQEVLTSLPTVHVGIATSHLNCAVLSHEYAVKFCNLCRDLHHISCLTQMLTMAQLRTQDMKEHLDSLEGMTMIAPTITSCESTLAAKLPSFKESHRDEDFFSSLGPLPSFSGDTAWGAPRTILLTRIKGTFGIFVRGSQPVVVSGIDHKGSADKAGIKVKDWVLAIDGRDVRYKSHDDVVAMVKECKDEVTLEVTTPEVEPAREASLHSKVKQQHS